MSDGPTLWVIFLLACAFCWAKAGLDKRIAEFMAEDFGGRERD